MRRSPTQGSSLTHTGKDRIGIYQSFEGCAEYWKVSIAGAGRSYLGTQNSKAVIHVEMGEYFEFKIGNSPSQNMHWFIQVRSTCSLFLHLNQ